MGEHIAILYHGDMDGLVAAWVTRHYLTGPGVHIDTFPVQYDTPLPQKFTTHHWSAIYILDFALPPKVFDELASKHTGKLVMLDHHKTAAEAYEEHWKIDGVTAYNGPFIWSPDETCKVVFHVGTAGCTMAELYFQGQYGEYEDPPSIPVILPKLVQYAADHDLWKFELPLSKEIRAAFHSYPMTLETCTALQLQLSRNFPQLAAEGAAILRTQQRIVDSAIANAEWIQLGDHRGLAVEMPVSGFISETAGKLSEEPGAAFGCCWFKVCGKPEWVYSLRSHTDFDVGQLAKSFHGGGHKAAAGFTSRRSPLDFLTMERPANKKC